MDWSSCHVLVQCQGSNAAAAAEGQKGCCGIIYAI
jgi:hypothetical protein